ncbi:MAG: class I SAM-dependent methyltransferase [Anaerolineae bacterium]
MKTTACILCAAGDAETLFVGRDRLHNGPGRFPVRRCRSCGSLYLSPRPEAHELKQYYPPDYAPYALPRSASKWQRWNLNYAVSKQIRAVLARVPGPGRALDVGCSTGDFIAALQQHDWRVQGVELNRQAAAYAQQRVKGPVFRGDFFQAGYAADTFDLVTFWDVLEHLPDPQAALLEAARITRPSGVLVLSLPNLHSLEARLFGRDWAGWDIPRHLWWLPRPALLRLLEETGWDVQEFTCLRGRHWLLALSLQLWLEAQSLPAALQKGAMALFRSLPMRVLWWPYFAMTDRLGLGSIVAIFARRKEHLIDRDPAHTQG